MSHTQNPKQNSKSPPDTQKQHQEQDSPPRKTLRRVAQRSQMPTDKIELIQYLSTRIKEAEEALTDTEELLESQVIEREKISKAITERNTQLEKLYELDQKALPDKIKEKLTEILTQSISQKVQAEESLAIQKNRNYQYKTRYDQLKWESNNIIAKVQQQTSKEQSINKDITVIEARCQNYEMEISELTQQFEQLKSKKENIENRYFQMKVALERMNDIRSVLNRFFGNEDLFDEKMDLKEQKIQRPAPPSLKEQSRLPSRDTKSNQPRLKPIQRDTKNDDEDFWKGDFSRNRPTF